MSQNLVPRMVALAVVIVLGVTYIAFDVLQYRLGAQPFTVTVQMPSAGGLYTGADVTYRGVQVGTVTALDLGRGRVDVQVGIDAGQRIPDNGLVRVKELSALGEQYLDLQPARGRGPDLTSGSVIPADRVVLPTPIGTTLVDLGRMLQGIDPQDLQTDETFLATAFDGTGPDLRTIIVTGQQLFDALVKAQPETVNLVLDGQKDLATLEATDGDLATFASGLASLTGQLRQSNRDLSALIRNGQDAEKQLDPFLAAHRVQIQDLVSGLAAAASASGQYQPQVRATFDLLPYVSRDLASVASGGEIHGILSFNTADPVCAYVPGLLIPGPTQPVATPPLDNACPAGQSPPRGATSNPTYLGG